MRYVYFNPNTLQVMQWIDTDAFGFELPDAASLLAIEDDVLWGMQGSECWVVGAGLTDKPRPSLVHDWDVALADWVVDADKQALIDVEVERLRREAWGTALDALMVEAVSIAQPLDYAASRKRLPADKAARLAAWNAYIDELAGLEYSEQAVWPVRPLV